MLVQIFSRAVTCLPQSRCLVLSLSCRWYHWAPRQQESMAPFLWEHAGTRVGEEMSCPIAVFAAATGTMHKAHLVPPGPELQVQQYELWRQESKPRLSLASSSCRAALQSVLGGLSRAVLLSRF